MADTVVRERRTMYFLDEDGVDAEQVRTDSTLRSNRGLGALNCASRRIFDSLRSVYPIVRVGEGCRYRKAREIGQEIVKESVRLVAAPFVSPPAGGFGLWPAVFVTT